MSYIYPAPGATGVEATLTIEDATNKYTANTIMVVPALQDMTVNAANDVFSWTQLDNSAKLQIATTSTNSISGNLVLDQTTFFGDGITDGVEAEGVFGLSTLKQKIKFSLYLGDEDDGGAGKYIEAEGYITGLTPTVSADSPVWVSPFTITVTGEYSVVDAATVV